MPNIIKPDKKPKASLFKFNPRSHPNAFPLTPTPLCNVPKISALFSTAL